MLYQIEFSRAAARDLRKFPRETQKQIASALETLGRNPRNHKVIKVTDSDAYRCRSGDFRIIFEIHDDRLVVVVLQIVNRKDAYK